MSETEEQPVTEPGAPDETPPTPSLPHEDPCPHPHPPPAPPEQGPRSRARPGARPPTGRARRAATRPAPAISGALTAADLDGETLGSGPRVVLVHGSIVDARRTWRHQLGLAERWTLVLPNR